MQSEIISIIYYTKWKKVFFSSYFAVNGTHKFSFINFF